MNHLSMKILNTTRRTLFTVAIMVTAVIIIACNNKNPMGGEESGIQYTKSQTATETLNGGRLIMSYDAQSNSFNGTVENITSSLLTLVRVEIHLSNGIELGPSAPTDLAPGAILNVTLQATGTNWTTWSVHPESGPQIGGGEGSEGNHGSEGGGG